VLFRSQIVEPIRMHHRVAEAKSLPHHLELRTRLVEFADRLAELEDTRSTPDDIRQILQTAQDQFSLAPEALEKLLSDVNPKIESFASLVQLDIGNSPRFAAVLNAGCEELVRLSMQTSPPAQSDADESAPHPSESASIDHGQQSTFQGPAARTTKPAADSDSSAARLTDPFELKDKFGGIEPGSQLLNYRIVRVVGRGAMGVVYEAIDVDLGRRVALKTLAPQRARNPEARQRFIREARTAAAVQHENVVAIFAVSECDGTPFIVMEYVAGRSLQDWLNSGRRFTVKEITRIGSQTARGLAAAHALRIIHRDIKPANILVEDGSERVRISDFGTARFVHSSNITHDGNIVGTPQYMSPEQVDGQPLGPASDLFSLGSLLYALCTGKAPFSGDSLYGVLHMVATEKPKRIRELNADIPDWLVGIVEKLHAKEPSGRIPSAMATAELLEAHGSGFHSKK
jgi:eukaryotic-like serine/threonine-protein kinase